jgi:hypothetical protein
MSENEATFVRCDDCAFYDEDDETSPWCMVGGPVPDDGACTWSDEDVLEFTRDASIDAKLLAKDAANAVAGIVARLGKKEGDDANH